MLTPNFLEDFNVGARYRHATPRTVSEGDSSLYIALTGARQPLFSSAPFARVLGYRDRPLDDMLVFNLAFGKTVPDISFSAIANLGYADLRFLEPVYAGDTIRAESVVIAVRQTSAGDSGVVHVRSDAYNQHGAQVMSWVRWVLIPKSDPAACIETRAVPDLPAVVSADRLVVPPLSIDPALIREATGSDRFWEDYQPGERIDHLAGMTIDESDHTLATRLYQNNATVHFDAFAQQRSRHGRRLVYGGHVISACKALSFDGLENALFTLAINGGAHRAPTFAGDTLYCFTEVKERMGLPGRHDLGALRLRLVGMRDHPPSGFSDRIADGGTSRFHPDVVLDLDYTVAVARRA